MEFGFFVIILFSVIAFKALRHRLGDAFVSAECSLMTVLLVGVVIAGGVQLLSALHALNLAGVVFVWLIACLLCAGVTYCCPAINHVPAKNALLLLIREADLESRVMAFVVFAFAALLGFVSVYAIPNNADSMYYHLVRVAYWRQYGSISFFGTFDVRQNSLSPFAEWSILVLSYLQGHIALANTIQWISYLGAILSIAEVSRLMGGSPRECLRAGFFCATLPMAILQASSTQNDLVLSFWLALALYGCIRSILIPGLVGTFIFGAAVSLALLTKPSTVIFAAPLLVWFSAVLLPRGFGNLLVKLALIGGVIACLNLGHVLRNIETAGLPFGPAAHDGQVLTNTVHSPGAVISNIIRNVGLHGEFLRWGVPATTSVVLKLHRWLGLDPFDPRTTWLPPGGIAFVGPDSEDGSAMPLHLILIAVGFVGIVFLGRSRYSHLFPALLGCIFISALLFCFALKWQLWNVRLQLPLFVMAAPIAAAVMERQMNIYVRRALTALLILNAAVYVCFNPVRPILGPNCIFTATSEAQRYRVFPDLLQPYHESMEILEGAGVKSIGLISGYSFEYPLLDPTEEGFTAPFKIDHILVDSRYSRFEQPGSNFDAIVCLDQPAKSTLTVHGKIYKNVYLSGLSQKNLPYIAVFLPLNSAQTLQKP